MKKPNVSFIIPKIMFFISNILIINPKENSNVMFEFQAISGS